ncbi:NACHT and WD repeat domain-containing protein [Nocardia sp. NPDC057227]|uniref:NACHT and WD repeat domain-containing protein n=1 Tax=Nocardia sp. NPDC057227 TaxID=3346056 RepID=UPI00362E1244
MPHYAAYSVGEDRGLWLVPNFAYRADAVAGRSSAGLVENLTRGVVVTPAVRQALTLCMEPRTQLTVLSGAAGAGKSTIMALLIRPRPELNFPVDPLDVSAAAFLDTTSTVESVTVDLVEQLRSRVQGFRLAQEEVRSLVDAEGSQSVTSFETQIVRPLGLCRRDKIIRLLIDGLDNLDTDSDVIARALAPILQRPELRHVQVIISVRSDEEPESLRAQSGGRITLPEPNLTQLHDSLNFRLAESARRTMEWAIRPGIHGWLVARLANEIDWRDVVPVRRIGGEFGALVSLRFRTAHASASAEYRPALDALAGILVAVGYGPVAPIAMVRSALEILGFPMATARIRDLLLLLGVLSARGRPGSPDETVGLAHVDFVEPLHAAALIARQIVLQSFHQAMISAYNSLKGISEVEKYWHFAQPRHLVGADRVDEAVVVVAKSAQSGRAADGQQTWDSWQRLLQRSLDPASAYNFALRLRRYQDRTYLTSKADRHVVDDLHRLLEDMLLVLGPHNMLTLTARFYLASWTSIYESREAGIRVYESLVNEVEQHHGRNNRLYVIACADLAVNIGVVRSAVEARNRLLLLLPHTTQLLGAEDKETIRQRVLLARYTRESGDLEMAKSMYADVIAVMTRVYGANHVETLATRGDLDFISEHPDDFEKGRDTVTNYIEHRTGGGVTSIQQVEPREVSVIGAPGTSVEDSPVELLGVSSNISCLSYHPAGELATGNWDGSVRIWDVSEHRRLRSLPVEEDRVHAVSYSDGGSRLAAGGDRGMLTIWNCANYDRITRVMEEFGTIRSLEFAASCDLLAIGGDAPAIILWDFREGREAARIEAHASGVLSLAWHPKMLILASGGWDGLIKLWDCENRNLLAILRGHSGSVSSMGFSSDGTMLVTGGADGTVRVWDTISNQSIGDPIAHPDAITCIAVGKRDLIASTSDDSVRLWHARSGEQYAVLSGGNSARLRTVRFSPRGETLAAAGFDRRIKLWTATQSMEIGEV